MLEKINHFFKTFFSLENPHIQMGIKTYRRFEHFAPPISFVAGFSYDSMTLTRIDRLSDNLVLLGYLLMLGLTILAYHLVEMNVLKYPPLVNNRHWIPVAIQFFLGGLFSAYVIFYFQSVSFTKGAFFLVILLVLLIANEIFHHRLTNIYLQIGLFFLAVFSFLTFFIPVVVKDIATPWFLLGGILSLGAVAGVLYLLYRYSAVKSSEQLVRLGAMVGGLYLMLNIFYFMNWIPPIPLSVRHAGVYHEVHRTEAGFEVAYQKQPWYAIWRQSDKVFEHTPADTVWCMAAVFAPTELRTRIYHHWQFFDDRKESWTTTDRIRYPIVGGRDGGYRGVTFKKNVAEGKWRVTVETEDTRVLGRVDFEIRAVDSLSLPLVRGIR
ncbi:MAG: DUF2914 domain-containing protein [Calditrichaeota bacterium]|nr:DUF2914 domain-containing protein [Calditrichota bacterium]